MAKAPPSNVPQTPLPNVTYAQGAIAIMAGGNTIGGLGLSGAPGGQFDEECARAAAAVVVQDLADDLAVGNHHPRKIRVPERGGREPDIEHLAAALQNHP
jgi:hypothetical protein